MRATIGWLMFLVLTAAVGLTSLRLANPAWEPDETRDLTVCALVIWALPLFLAMYTGRAFPVGFALGAWGYLLLSLGPGLDPPDDLPLPTTRWLEAAYHYVYPESYLREVTVQREFCSCQSCFEPTERRYRAHFFRIAQPVTSLLAGALGGFAAYGLALTLRVLRGRLRPATRVTRPR
jgi:hypothetical protein